MLKSDVVLLLYILIINLICCLNGNSKKRAYILNTPKSSNCKRSSFRRWNNPVNNNINELKEDEDLIKYELQNGLSNIIYKKRKSVNKKKYILNNENHVILPTYKISDEYKCYINPIDYNYEELHVYMEVNTGSVNEKKNQQGISHLCEHVSYMGSKNRKNIVDKNIRTNAYTDFHHIVFYISVSLNNEIYKENFYSDFKCDQFIKNIREEDIEDYDIYTVDEFNYKHAILSQCIDTMVEVLKGETQFNKERITKEKKAIFSEYSIINNIEYKMNSDIIKVLHKENRLSHRLPIGKLELLKRYGEKDVKEYFNLFFRPENVNFFVYGDVNVDIAQKLISSKLENIKGKDLKEQDKIYLNILNDRCTLRSRNKNLPAVFHMFGNNSDIKVKEEEEEEVKKNIQLEKNEKNIETKDEKFHINNNENITFKDTDENFQEDDYNNKKENDCNTYDDDNIIDLEKYKEFKRNENDIVCELKFRNYLKNKYGVNMEEEKLLNKNEMKNINTSFEIIKYSLNNVNINILLKEEIKSVRTLEDLKISVIKEVIFYCLSFRFNIHRNNLFNSIDINEYTNINEGATIRTIEIKTTIKAFEKTIECFYNFIKSLLKYGFSEDELLNYKMNEIDYEDDLKDVEEKKSGQIIDHQNISHDVSEAYTNSNKHSSKNMKLIHPHDDDYDDNHNDAEKDMNNKMNEQDEEYILDSTKINETYTDEIQKIIDYNTCQHIYLNEKREKKIKREIFEKLKLQEINNFAKQYFQYLFNIFNPYSNMKPHCVVIHVPSKNENLFHKNKIRKLFFNNIYSMNDVQNYSINIQNKLLSPHYVYENITKKLSQARYIIPQKRENKYSEDIFNFIVNKMEDHKNENIFDVNNMCLSLPFYGLSTNPDLNMFKKCYCIKENKDDHINNVNDHMNETKILPQITESSVQPSLPTSSKKSNNNLCVDMKEKPKTMEINNKYNNMHDDVVCDNRRNNLSEKGVTFLNLKNYVLSLKNQKEIENYELLNGIKVNLYKTKVDKKNIYMRLIIPHNDIIKKKKENVHLLLFSIICLFEGGEIENVTREHVEIHCSNKSINIYIDINDEYFFIDIYTHNKYENISSAFSILNNIILETKIENTALPRVVDKLKKDFFEYKNSLQSLLLGQTISYVTGGKIGYQNFEVSDTENITMDDVQRMLKHIFSDLSLFELTIVGDFSDFIHYYILHYLGTLQGKIIEQEGEKKRSDVCLKNNKDNIIIEKHRTNNLSNESYPINEKKKKNEDNGCKSNSEILLNDYYSMLCPFADFEEKSKNTTYVYIKEKEEHGIFLLVGKGANMYGFLSNGIHISFYLMEYLKRIINGEEKNKNCENIYKDEYICNELDKIKSQVLEDFHFEDKHNINEYLKKKKKLYTSPLFFNAVSYIIQYILNSKLFHYLREKKELTYDSSFEFISYEKYFAGFFTILVQTNPRDLELIKKEVLSCIELFTTNYNNFSDYLIENSKLSYLNKKNKDLKYFVDKISGMQLTHFPLKYKNKHILKDNILLNKIQKIDVLLVLFILFNQTKNYHISYGISAPHDIWKETYKNINKLY
ncbi:stromal-processing peptidase [Plasmodium falciparum NF54]|uniref:Stromal-processing peptidase, putative n=5 Tax=Plasmodium falciparum TaxID=5833 RepID=Q8IL67_PLAF7|nr:stromal-processing peptidase, putative [Plasmodium falciparum 3D7]KAF4329266.1 stromal-processing peptidase [Plasmodium falciparum NF54]PKC49973.1 stromal-processing peptidase [Plasmodium falciparum NF54]CZU00099.1 stromal-processing peptidase, putative [Plasmodium falciparum 3D7]|eukprot:XP_001348556.2 stromal-processing peptidase, putative [Plasmodium falciparum 3D7]